MLGIMPITMRVIQPDKNMQYSRKRPAPAAPVVSAAATLSHMPNVTNDDTISIPIAKRLHLDQHSSLGNGDSNHNAAGHVAHPGLNGQLSLVGVLPNGVHVSKLNGDNGESVAIRRKASMNAEVALQLLMDESPPVSPTQSRSAKTEAKSTATPDDDPNISCTTTLVPSLKWSNPLNGLANASHNTPKLIVSSEKSIPEGHGLLYDSDYLETSPVSSPCYRLSPQRLFDAESTGEGLSVASFYQKGKLKQPKIHLIKHQSKRHQPKSKAVNDLRNPLYNSSVLQGGYVKRMASLNAAACVSAMMEPQKKNTARHSDTGGGASRSNHQPHNVTATPTLSQSMSVHSKPLSQMSHKNTGTNFDPSLQLIERKEDQLADFPPLYLSDYSTDVDEDNEMRMSLVHNAPAQPCSLEDLSFVSVGLLHDGSTIHPNTRVFYKTDKNLRLSLPERIMPVLVPSKMENVQRAIESATTLGVRKATRKKTRKGNNGWYPMGDPIKSIQIKKGTTKVVRKYYTGIKRRHEEIFVRDAITVSSGDLEHSKPYVAKVASIWQESDHRLMVTLFWYYRPTEVDMNKTTSGVVPPEFYEKEILASQHHDDNSVACIEEKCYVLGLQHFCRYRAIVKNNFSLGAKALVPEPPQHQFPAATNTRQTSATSNADSQEFAHHTLNESSLNSDLPCTTPSLQELRNVDQDLVFLCYRGYNHISGKLSTKPRK